MRSVAKPEFWRSYESLSAEAQRQARRAFRLWRADPYHPSLQFKRVTRTGVVSARVGLHWRALGQADGDTVIWFWIGSHSDYDKLLSRR